MLINKRYKIEKACAKRGAVRTYLLTPRFDKFAKQVVATDVICALLLGFGHLARLGLFDFVDALFLCTNRILDFSHSTN